MILSKLLGDLKSNSRSFRFVADFQFEVRKPKVPKVQT